MLNNHEIIELFPTPVYASVLPQELSKVVPWFYSQEMLSEEIDAPNYGERSKNSYLLDEPQCVDLRSYILEAVNQYGKTMGFDYDEYRFGQSWLSYKQPGQHHTMHTHPNSLISGVFYFGEGSQETPVIRFHKMGVGTNVSTISPKLVDKKKDIKYAQSVFNIDFTPGLLLLFPSYLHHSVPVNNTDKIRCSLAFNVVPKVGFGDERSLTELKF